MSTSAVASSTDLELPDGLPDTFKGLFVDKTKGQPVTTEIRDLTPSQLPDYDVTLKVHCSTLNYKDALALTGAPGVVRAYPIVPGIDYVGTVMHDRSAKFPRGTKVILTGHGVGEKCWGGYAEYARAKSEWLVKLPESITPEQAMSVGTAGFTAMLCVLALENAGIKARTENGQSRVLVTGASGGVGVTSVALLSQLGYSVTASSGRQWTHERLKHLGAQTVIGRLPSAADEKIPALGKEKWDAVIDSVGGETLARTLAQTRAGGAVAACGLAGGTALNTTVFPFILRGVSLLGIDSVYYPTAQRDAVWQRLAQDLPWEKFGDVTSRASFAELPELSKELLTGKSDEISGRTIIDCGFDCVL